MNKTLLILLSLLAGIGSMHAIDLSQVRFFNEETDTAKINAILSECMEDNIKTPNGRIGQIARMFIGTPYVAHTLEGDSEMLTVNLDQLDCTTFVETVAALALTTGERRGSWRDFLYNLERIRYRNGQLDGYPSRLHYICDWIVDNVYRGNISEVTRNFPRHNYTIKTIDFMSANRDRYPALRDSTVLERIKNVEIGYRNHRYPYIKKSDLYDKNVKAAFKDGDIVALTSNIKNLDVTHMGIIVIRDGEPYLLHASSSLGKVVITDQPLQEFMKKNNSLTGLRVIRLNE